MVANWAQLQRQPAASASDDGCEPLVTVECPHSDLRASCSRQEAQARLGVTRGGSAHAGMEFYRPIDGFPGATTSLGRRTSGSQV